MRVLIIHNQLWAHYKSKLFSEISANMKLQYPDSKFHVAHIALHEASRSGMQDEKSFPYEYSYEVLFQKNLDQVGFSERLRALIRTFDSFKPTVLNVTGWFDWAQVILMVYARRKGVKIVLSSESSTADHNRSGIKEKIKKWIVGMADAFFCFGKSSADYLINLGINRSKIAVDNAAVIDEDIIKSNFDQAKKQLPNSQADTKHNTFVFVGRLAPEKNLEMLLGSFMKLQDEEPIGEFWNLLFVGEGPEKKHLQELAAKSSFPGNIQFAGGFPWYKVPSWLAKSDILVLPSLSEPWGLVVNEAMVCGMPVIVSETCGCAGDLVSNGVNGFTFNPKKQPTLDKALFYFMQHPDKINEMGMESKKLVERFSSKKVAAEMVKCYHNL
ncbi:glycosyltransferase family 4 protein [Dyadobacter sp. CY312]|uniref:glycosyltransferase family 4 protein n=1 Tax=Dyadobacter sp. CY312 TaxID=2907303 RepID=UPI001F3488E5|nr:glycosyltransferase family 4 protein [Dyadobacter sp. CY312]MCE7039493.1 glycosyltransferase family 4 protein [Dyadobacter sp. CY312]